MITPFQAAFYQFLSGAAMLGGGVCGLFFMRFWRRTGDRFFLYFALAFWTLALERLPLIFIDPMIEDRIALVYLIRMFAFLLILKAVWEKNRPLQGGLR